MSGFPLLRKELREQRAFLAFGLFLFAVDLLDELVRGFDLRPLGLTFRPNCDESLTLGMIIGFAVGTGLLVREQDEGTLAFLDGLPVSRARVFWSKLLVALGVLLAYPALRAVLLAVLHLLGRGSLDHALHPQLLLANFGLAVLLTFTALALGMGLGFFRSLSWFVLAVLLGGVGLGVRAWPALAALDPTQVCELQYVGTSPRFDPPSVLGPLTVAMVSLGAGWAFFVGRRERLWRALRGLSERPVLSAVAAVATIAAVGGVVALFSRDSERGSSARGDEPLRFSTGAPAVRETRHYRFHYRSTKAPALNALADQADEAFEQVHALLGVDGGTVVDVDTSGSMENTQGTAAGDRIRLVLDDEALPTLAHETTHVVARRLAGGAEGQLLDQLRTFNEGLAHWVERRYRPAEAIEAERLVAATMSARGEVLATELLDEALLSKNRSPHARYLLGAALVEALVARYGPLAPRKVLEAAGSQTLRTNLSPEELAQAVFQLAGFDLSLVLDDVFRQLAKEQAERAEAIARLPRVHADLVSDGEGRFGVLPTLEGPELEGWRLTVRFRPSDKAPLRSYESQRTQPGEPAWREPGEIARGEVCFQVIIVRGEGHGALSEPWSCVPTSAASPWTPDAGD